MKLKSLILLALVVLLSACSLAQFKENEQVMELITRGSVGRILTEHPKMVEPTYRITGDTIMVIESGTLAEIGQLEKYVADKIDWEKLTPEERDLTLFLIGQVRSDLEEKLALRGITAPGEVKVVLVEVLTWINETARVRLNFSWFDRLLDQMEDRLAAEEKEIDAEESAFIDEFLVDPAGGGIFSGVDINPILCRAVERTNQQLASVEAKLIRETSPDIQGLLTNK